MDSKDVGPTFNAVAAFVRDWARVPAEKQITPATQFERDLGITGDDGVELLEAAQKRFKVNFTNGDNGIRTIFKLGPNEYLFNSEGFPAWFGKGGLFSTSDTNYTVRAFTIGELCVAIQQASRSAT